MGLSVIAAALALVTPQHFLAAHQLADGSFAALGYVRKVHAKEGLEVRWAEASQAAKITRVAPYTRE